MNVKLAKLALDRGYMVMHPGVKEEAKPPKSKTGSCD